MALHQSILILVILASSTKGNLPANNWTTVYRFSPPYSGNTYFVLEPKVPVSNSTGYSICLRVCIWRWEFTILFETSAVRLEMYNYDKVLICFFAEEGDLCFTWVNVNSEWNALCFTHSFEDFILTVTLNGEPMGSETVQITNAFLDKLTKPLSIGSESLFWGQITDFNIWNRPLSKDEVIQYSLGCHEGISTRPQILEWSTTNITKQGIHSTHFKTLLSCQSGMMKPFYQFFINTNVMNYKKSVELCILLRGDLFDPNFLEFELVDHFKKKFWVPTDKLERNGKQTINNPLTIGQESDQCMIVDITSRNYSSISCQEYFPSICKV
jgi:hypothetical protein